MSETSPAYERSPTGGSGLDPDTAHRARLMQAGQMLAGVVHEINNPLAVIQGYAEMLLDRIEGADERRDLGCILDEARRLGTLVEDMLAFTRRGSEEREPLDLSRVVSSAINLTTHSMRQARISVVASLPERSISVSGSHGGYVQVLLNLLDNARQSLETVREHGRGISIRVEPGRPGHTQLVVSNNGPPIPADVAPRIFEAFYTSRPGGEGSGLGLALCRDILARYQASIHLDSSTSEGGVTFRIEMPEA
jgi:signal transduction histidine kinase